MQVTVSFKEKYGDKSGEFVWGTWGLRVNEERADLTILHHKKYKLITSNLYFRWGIEGLNHPFYW